MTIQDIIFRTGVDPLSLLYVFQYGSRVYGSNTYESDWDFIIVTNDKDQREHQFIEDDLNVTFYNIDRFKELRDAHDIAALECMFLPDENVWAKSTEPEYDIYSDFSIDLVKLRSSISHTASNSWVKAKKKLIVEADRDLNTGLKSLYHSLRILLFGTQIAMTGKISNYQLLNGYRSQIFLANSIYTGLIKAGHPEYAENQLYKALWDELDRTYTPAYNQYATEFRKRAPKAVTNN